MPFALALCSLVLALGCAPTEPRAPRGDTAKSQLPDLVGGGLLPSPADEHLRREHAQALELASTLEQLAGVDEARVHLSLPLPSPFPGAARSEPRAAVLLRRGGPAHPPDIEAARRLLLAAIPGLSADQVVIEVTAPVANPDPLVAVGPLLVAQRSAALTRGLLGGLLALVLILGAVLAGAGWKQRRSRIGL